MINILISAHSGLRWVVLILLVVTIVDSLIRMYRPVNETDKKLALFTLISVHTQALLGLLLYFFGEKVTNIIANQHWIMKDGVNRFWVVEHLAGMILAAVLITIGYSRAKRMSEKWAKHRMIFVYYFVGFILIMLSIPWPWREAAKALNVGWI